MKQKSVIQIGIPILGICLFLCFPLQTRDGVQAGLALCGGILIPSLFPVSVLASCLIRMQAGTCGGSRTERWMRALFGLPGSAALPLLLGILGGFPLGAQLTASAYESGQLSKQEAARLAGLSNNAGPAFLLGAVSVMLGSLSRGAILMGIQLASSLLAGCLLRESAHCPVHTKKVQKNQPASIAALLPQCITESAVAMLRLTGAICFFHATTACVIPLLPVSNLPTLWQAGLSGVLELTGGLSLLRGTVSPALMPLTAALISWGGLCVHLQSFQALAKAEIPMGPYLRHKTLQAGIALLLAFFL